MSAIGTLNRPRRVLGVRRERWIQYVVVIVPAVLLLGALAPIVFQSFLDRPLYEAGGMFTPRNYVRLFTELDFLTVARNTLYFAALSTVLALAIGVTLAVALTRTNVPGAGLLGSVMQWPIYISPLVLSFGWIIVYGPAGFVSVWFRDRLDFVPWNLYSIPGMAATQAVALAPLAYLLCSGALKQGDSSLEDAARVSGARPLRVLVSVVVPMLRPAVLYSGLVIFSACLEELSMPLLYGLPSQIQIFASFIYIHGVNSTSPDYGMLGAAAMLTLVVTIGLVILQARLLRNAERFVAVGGKAPQSRKLDLGRTRWLVLGAIIVYLAAGPVIPMIGLVLRAFTTVLTPLINPFSVLTMENFHQVFGYGVYVDSITNSLIVAIVGAVLLSLFMSIVVVVARRSDFRFRRALEFLVLAPQAIPGIVLGIGFFWAFAYVHSSIGTINGTLVALLIAFGTRSFPQAFGALAPVVMEISQDLDHAARSVGADWWHTFTRVLARMLVPGFFAAFVVVFVQMFKEFSPAIFLSDADSQVIGTTTLHLWIQGDTGNVAALATLQVLMAAVGVLIAGRLLGGGNTYAATYR